MKSLERKFLKEFIDLYKKEVVLWQVRHVDYTNKEERDKSWRKLLDKANEYEKDANIETVKRKINSLRTSYRRELHKCKTGNYVSSLWYMRRLSFISHQQEGKENEEDDDFTSQDEEEDEEEEEDDTEMKGNLELGNERHTIKLRSAEERRFLEEFIEIYKNEVGLWHKKHEKYNNKLERKKSWAKLLRKAREYDEDSNLGSVKRKLNSLRTSYRREFNRSKNPTYKTSLWYYKLLDFLSDDIGDMNEDDEEWKDDDCNNDDNDVDDNQVDYNEFDDNDVDSNDASDDDSHDKKDSFSIRTLKDPLEMETKSPIKRLNVDTPEISAKKLKFAAENKIKTLDKIPNFTEDDFLQVAAKYLINAKKQPIRDEANVFSEGWGMLFRKLDEEQKVYAKRIIDDVLMYGQLGQLRLSTKLDLYD